MGKAIPKTAARRREISSYSDPMFGNCSVLSYSTMLVETVNIFKNLNFNWPAGLHLWNNPKSSSTTTQQQQRQQKQLHGLYISTPWSIGLLVPVSLVLCWRNMTTEYSSPYKVGLINIGTKFAQSRPVWSEIAYGKLNFRGTIILLEKVRSYCKPCTTSISPSNNSTWYKVRGFFSLLGD